VVHIFKKHLFNRANTGCSVVQFEKWNKLEK